jgi:hypothetical protein
MAKHIALQTAGIKLYCRLAPRPALTRSRQVSAARLHTAHCRIYTSLLTKVAAGPGARAASSAGWVRLVGHRRPRITSLALEGLCTQPHHVWFRPGRGRQRQLWTLLAQQR